MWAQGHEPLPSAVSLFPLMSWCQWSFWTPPLSRIFRTFPGSSQGNCPPPSSETLPSPTAQSVFLSTSPRELPADGEETPSFGPGFTGVFLLGDFYLLDVKVEQYRAIFFIKLNVTHESMEWPALGDLLYVVSCHVMGFPSSCELQIKFPSEIIVHLCKFCPTSSLRSFPALSLEQKLPIFMNTALGIKSYENSCQIKEIIEVLLR